MNSYHFAGTLTRVPFPGKPSAALARLMPVENENDFAVFAELPCSEAPILINFIEHYQILETLVNNAQKLWPEGLPVVVRISMPGGMRLPKALLADNVLLVQEVAPEVDRLMAAGNDFLVIEDRFIRYQLERGRNEINIRLFSQNNEQKQLFNMFVESLSAWGVESK